MMQYRAMNRRDVLRSLGLAAVGACMPSGAKTDSSAVAAVPGGAPAATAAEMAPGIQLYAVRKEAERDLDATLKALGQMGYREVETAGLYGRTPRAFRDALDRAGLAAPSAHMDISLLRGEKLRESLDAADVLGHEWIVVPWVSPKDYPTADHWRRFADELAALGARVKERGKKLAFHNHDFEVRKLPDGTVPLDVLLAVDPSLLRIEMDVFWVVQGGADPFAYFTKHPGRFDMIHVKDRAPDGKQTDIGKGTIDYHAVYAQATAAGIKHAFVEHDNPPDPLAFARNSLAHLRTLRPR